MLTFHETMDPHSLDVKRDGKLVAMLQWHDDKPCVCVTESWQRLSLMELSEIVQHFGRIKNTAS